MGGIIILEWIFNLHYPDELAMADPVGPALGGCWVMAYRVWTVSR